MAYHNELMPFGDTNDLTPLITIKILISSSLGKFKMLTIKTYDVTGELAKHVRTFSSALLL